MATQADIIHSCLHILYHCYYHTAAKFLFQTHLTGRVEDLRVVVLKRESSISLDISNIVIPSQTRTKPVVHKTIVYTN